MHVPKANEKNEDLILAREEIVKLKAELASSHATTDKLQVGI